MQVSQVNDRVTHAVIGGQAPISFGISDSPEFFHILSSTLYQDQKLAVIRETLCNAWDAHIAAGITHVALKVTLTHDKLTIQDFGPGIHHDMIGAVYGTYGNSTKKNDGKQTGGFGLGCKSPFAYGDHFQVDSCHQGTKTIYTLSKSSAERMGKPAITTIASFPTTETGLTMRMDVKRGDYQEFDRLIKQITFNGEMMVIYNGGLLPMLELSQTEHGWIVTPDTVDQKHTQYRIYIRYGNVIYPVENHDVFATERGVINQFLQNRVWSTYSMSSSNTYKLIMMAPPDSVSVMPSREGLSMSDHTVSTLKTMLSGFCKLINNDLSSEFYRILDRQIQKVTEEKSIKALLNSDHSIPGFRMENILSVTTEKLQTVSQLAERVSKFHYPSENSFYQKDIIARLDGALAAGIGKRGHVEQLKALIKGPSPKMKAQARVRKPGWSHLSGEYRHARAWFKQRILRPLYRDMQADPVLDHNRLFMYLPHQGENGLVQASQRDFQSFTQIIPALRNIVVLTYGRTDLRERMAGFEEWKQLGSWQDVFVYHAPMARTRITATREFFTKRGFTLLDLTVPQPWVEQRVAAAKSAVAKRPKRIKLEGYPTLAGVKYNGKRIRVDNCFLEGQPRTNTPLFYEKIVPSRAEDRQFSLGSFNFEQSRIIVNLFGDEGVLVRTDTDEEKLKAAGVPELNDYVTQFLISQATTEQKFLDYWQDCIIRGGVGNLYGSYEYYGQKFDARNQATTLFDLSEVRTILGLNAGFDDRDRLVLDLWRSVVRHDSVRHVTVTAGTKWKDAMKLVSAMPVSQNARDLGKDLLENPFLGLFGSAVIEAVLRKPEAELSGYADRLARMALIALKG